ncbi:hypothetical protein HYC85_021429 [Camellia sinensis]|uniref:Uncharacterized protein n=1 Tax=Camellia sinensis TaxID=4442 RepID=A0A7J7GHL4_CAMSI|nr:hypothetical protein HYC85_021429 [Camellia sinensis]
MCNLKNKTNRELDRFQLIRTHNSNIKQIHTQKTKPKSEYLPPLQKCQNNTGKNK